MHPTRPLQPKVKNLPVEWIDVAWVPRIRVTMVAPIRHSMMNSDFRGVTLPQRQSKNRPGQFSPAAPRSDCATWWLGRLVADSHVSVLSTFPPNLMKKRAHKPPSVRHGFTLIELLVVISIIAILAAMLLPVLGRVRLKAQVQRAQNEIVQIKDAIQQYETAYSAFPSTRTLMNDVAKTGDDFTYGTFGTTGLKDASGVPYTITSPSVLAPGPGYQTNNAELMAVLMDIETYGNGAITVNKDHVKNPQRTGFLNAKLSGDLKSGGVGLDGVYRDVWGNPYIISLDLNSDDKCMDAFYRLASVSKIGAGPGGQFGLMNTKDLTGNNFEYNGKVMVWSAGPDGKVDPNAGANTGANKDNVLSWK